MTEIITLRGITVSFLLKDPTISNDELAQHLQLRPGQGNATKEPDCCFYALNMSRHLVAIRTEPGVLLVIIYFENHIELMEEIATRINTS